MVFEILPPSLSVVIIAGIILIVINAFYRFLINQDRAAELKARMRELGKRSRENPDQSKELMKETMTQQRELMKMNMKPMLASFVIVAILLPYLALTFQDVTFAKTDTEVEVSGQSYAVSYQDGSAEIAGQPCSLPCKVTITERLWKVEDAGDDVRLSLIVAQIPPGIPGIGGWELSWLFWYIISSLPLAIIVRIAYGIRS